MATGPVIVFALTVRVCGSLITDTCHYERVADFSTEAVCRAAGRLMVLYPSVFGFHCKIETREYQYRTGVGNPF